MTPVELNRALSQISEIHAQVLKNEVFRGYRAVTMGLTGLCALAGAMLQGMVLGAAASPLEFVVYWVAIAGVCTALTAGDVALHARQMGAGHLRRQTVPVVAQFVPAIFVGSLATYALLRLPDSVGLLPGVWAMVYGLGVFSSRPYLPRTVGWVALYYLCSGAALLGADPESVPGGWRMGLVFGLGQGALALVLHIGLERGGLERGGLERGGLERRAHGEG